MNGEFWYDIYMLERYDQEYFKEHYDVQDTVLVADGGHYECKEYKTQEQYEETIEWIKNTDFAEDEQWELLKEKIDIQSYIDYMVSNIYLCNTDFSQHKNYRYWFAESVGGPYEDGRIRWAIYDLDLTGEVEMNTFSEELPYGNGAVNKNPFYQAFYVNEEYRKQFVLSFMDMANNNFSPENMEPILNKYGLGISWNDDFFLKRFDYITGYLADEFQLAGTLETVDISVNDIEGGSITVNTSVISLSDGNWSGKYYTDYPVTITAKADEGYIFAGWEGDISQTDEVIVTSVENGVKLKAIFYEK